MSPRPLRPPPSRHDDGRVGMKFYFLGQRHTLASALRSALEAQSDGEHFVACSHLHPLDDHVVVETPSERLLRDALLGLKATLGEVRRAVASR